MKSAVQTISRESSRPAFPPNQVIQLLPDKISVHNGQTIQWRWDNNFSVSVTKGAFESKSVNAEPDPDGLYWTTPPLRVVGNPNDTSTCIYTSLPDPMAADTDLDPPPPPPPNVVIVDNSTPQGCGEK